MAKEILEQITLRNSLVLPAGAVNGRVLSSDVNGLASWKDIIMKTAYGTEAQAATITLTSLASAAARESTVISNLTNLFLDALVSVRLKVVNTAPTGDKACYIYAYGTVDYSTPIYPDAVTGADAAITLNSPINLPLLGTIFMPTANLSYKAGPWSVARLFGGMLPEKWGIVVVNALGQALTATAADHKVLYQGVYATSS